MSWTDGRTKEFIESVALGLERPVAQIRDEELRDIEILSLMNHREVGELSLVPNVTRLILRGGEVNDLAAAVPQLPNLITLKLWFVPVESVSSLSVCAKLEKLELTCCLVEDLSPLLELPELFSATMWGLPLTEHSYFEHVPRLADLLLKQSYGANTDPFLRDREPVWRLCRELYERGLRAVFYEGKHGIARVGFPGLQYTNQPELERFDCDEAVLRALLDEHAELDTQQLFGILTEMPWAERAPSQTSRG